jgi:hypothetical protein
MAIDAVQAIHSSSVVQNIEAIDNAQRNPNPQSQGSAVPQDKVTISRAAQAHQAASAGDRDHDGDSK